MDMLKEKICKDGVVKSGEVLLVDSFLNHQLDIALLERIGQEFCARFAGLPINKVLTMETSGIAVAVADGDEGKAHLVKVAHAVVGDIPAQHTVANLVILMADLLPLLRREMAEGRQIAVVFFAHCLQFPEGFVDLGAFHECFLLLK